MLTVKDLILIGRNKLRSDHAHEASGNLKLSSIGCIYKNDVVGKCHRLALLDIFKIGKPVEDDRLMQQGIMMERFVKEALEATDHKIYTQKEYAVKYQIGDIKVSGLPDFIIVSPDGTKQGMEMKTVCSTSTAELVDNGNMKTEHLIQSALYSYKLDIPYTLMYWNSNKIKKAFPKKGESSSIEPFEKHYQLEWRDDELYVHNVKTVVTKSGVDAFVNLVDLMIKHDDLGSMFTTVEWNGDRTFYKTKGKYKDNCDYCELRSACHKYSKVSDFIEEAKLIFKEV